MIKPMYIQYKNGTKRPFKDADGEYVYSPDLDAFNTCGIVLTDTDIVLDFDNVDKQILRNLIKVLNINTEICWTERGVHLFFKKPNGVKFPVNAIAKCGLPVEYKKKTGKNISITRKMNGVPRETYNLGKREELPEFLYPFKKGTDSDTVNLSTLQQGSRNNNLFKYGLLIKSLKNWQTYLKWANENILDEPLPEKEIDAIVNSVQAHEGGTDNEFSEDYNLAQRIIKEKRVYLYKELLWVLISDEPLTWSSQDEHLRKAIGEIAKGQSASMLSAIFTQLKYHAPIIREDTIFPVRFANGTLENGHFDTDDDERFSPYTINIVYDKHAQSVKIVDDYLNHLTQNDENYKRVVLEMMGHCLITNPEKKKALGKFFFLHGGGGNGKGTLLEIITAILGRSNVSNVSPKQLKDERYSNALIGKLANLADDVEDVSLDNDIMKIMKNISTCDNIQLRKLNHNAIETRVTATLINTTNHLLKSFEKGDSFRRRMLWLPMFTKVEKFDGTFITRITAPQALSYWVRLIIEAYERLWANGEFTKSEMLNEAQTEYHRNNNNTIMFLEDTPESEIRWRTISDIYTSYEQWCDDACEKPLAKIRLTESIRQLLNLESKLTWLPNGSNRGRYFVPVGYDAKTDKEQELKWLNENLN